MPKKTKHKKKIAPASRPKHSPAIMRIALQLKRHFEQWQDAKEQRVAGSRKTRSGLRDTLKTVLDLYEHGLRGKAYVQLFLDMTGKKEAWAHRCHQAAIFAEKAGILDERSYNDKASWAYKCHLEELTARRPPIQSPLAENVEADVRWDKHKGDFETMKPIPTPDKMAAASVLFKRKGCDPVGSLARKYVIQARELGDLPSPKSIKAEISGKERFVIHIDSRITDAPMDEMICAVMGFLSNLARFSDQAKEIHSRVKPLFGSGQPFQLAISGTQSVPKNFLRNMEVELPAEDSIGISDPSAELTQSDLTPEEQAKIQAVAAAMNSQALRQVIEKQFVPKWSLKQSRMFES